MGYRHKTTRSTFKTEIYFFLKLTMGMLGFCEMLENPRRIFHTLVESKDHFDHFHKGEHPIKFQNNSGSNSPIKISKEPLYQDQLKFGAQARQCEDCLRCQFQPFKLQKMNNIQDLADFWKMIFGRVRQLASALK